MTPLKSLPNGEPACLNVQFMSENSSVVFVGNCWKVICQCPLDTLPSCCRLCGGVLLTFAWCTFPALPALGLCGSLAFQHSDKEAVCCVLQWINTHKQLCTRHTAGHSSPVPGTAREGLNKRKACSNSIWKYSCNNILVLALMHAAGGVDEPAQCWEAQSMAQGRLLQHRSRCLCVRSEGRGGGQV